MSFSGYVFLFNGISSDNFGLTITNPNPSGENDSPLITSTNFITQKSANSSKYYQIGAPTSEPLTFQIEFFSENPIYSYDRERIAFWLSGNGQFKKLKIIQDDMTSIYYNCYFSKIDWTNISGNGYGFKGTVVCDSPFAWRSQTRVLKVNKPTGGSSGNYYYPEQTKVDITNSSSDYNLIIPNIKVRLGDNNNKFRVTNTSNNNEFFEFSGLQNGEQIHITNTLIITSITNPNKIIIDNFSGDFLELVHGKNKIVIDGQIKEFELLYTQSKSIGG